MPEDPGNDTIRIHINRKTGEVRAIYDDRILPYIDRLKSELDLPDSAVTISRATHIEPDEHRTYGGNWYLDFTPVDGPLVYCDDNGHPFVQRTAALLFERQWLIDNWLCEQKGEQGC